MKVLVITFTMSFFATMLIAQRLHIGFFGGTNYPSIYSPNPGLVIKPSKEHQKQKAVFGVGLVTRINKYMDVRSEVFYEERGWYERTIFAIDPSTGNNVESVVDYFYPFLTVPVLLQGRIGKRVQIFANCGMNTSLRIGGKTITEDGAIPVFFIYPEDKKPTFDFAWVAGSGFRVLIGKRALVQAEYRYYKSLVPIGVGFAYDSVLRHKGQLLTFSTYIHLKKSTTSKTPQLGLR